MMALKEATTLLNGNPLIEAVDEVPRGHLRLASAFRYPDGSTVDLFIVRQRDLLSDVAPLTLTDFGNTFLWLDQLDIRPLKSARRKQLTQDVLETYEISQTRGALFCSVDKKNLLPGLIRLGQACLRIADLIFTQCHDKAQSSIDNKIKNIISNSRLEYKKNAEIIILYRDNVTVDFLINGPHLETAVFTLPAESTCPNVARNRANDVFVRCYDLQSWKGQRVAVLDDRGHLYRVNDLDRIREVATVIPISETGLIKTILLAAA